MSTASDTRTSTHGGTADGDVRDRVVELVGQDRYLAAAKVWHLALVQDLLNAEEAYAYDLHTGGLTTATTRDRCAAVRRALEQWFRDCLLDAGREVCDLVDRWADAA